MLTTNPRIVAPASVSCRRTACDCMVARTAKEKRRNNLSAIDLVLVATIQRAQVDAFSPVASLGGRSFFQDSLFIYVVLSFVPADA